MPAAPAIAAPTIAPTATPPRNFLHRSLPPPRTPARSPRPPGGRGLVDRLGPGGSSSAMSARLPRLGRERRQDRHDPDPYPRHEACREQREVADRQDGQGRLAGDGGAGPCPEGRR